MLECHLEKNKTDAPVLMNLVTARENVVSASRITGRMKQLPGCFFSPRGSDLTIGRSVASLLKTNESLERWNIGRME